MLRTLTKSQLVEQLHARGSLGWSTVTSSSAALQAALLRLHMGCGCSVWSAAPKLHWSVDKLLVCGSYGGAGDLERS